MKIIHCADLHLDSRMSSNLGSEKAKERKAELLATWQRMVRYAADNGVSAILIAGDLFDTKKISVTARNAVLDAVKENSGITFCYLCGNHEGDSFTSSLDAVPENLKLFGNEWRTYTVFGSGKKVTVSGIEPGGADPRSTAVAMPVLDADGINIVMLHGQDSEHRSKDRAEVIGLRDYRNRSVDYLALGHVHSYRCEKLDARGVYCYPGCLEGRGFDECGAHGFVLLDIDEKLGTVESSFVPFAKRTLYTVEADVSDCMTTGEAKIRAKEALDSAGVTPDSLVKVVLTGTSDISSDLDADVLSKLFEGEYYFLKAEDETKPKVDYRDFSADASLKGEFVRTVMADDTLSEEDKAYIIRVGIDYLAR